MTKNNKLAFVSLPTDKKESDCGCGSKLADGRIIHDSGCKNLLKNKEEETKELPKMILGEYQLCPKCNGDGHLGRYNSPSTSSCVPTCDICNGGKMLIKPIISSPLQDGKESQDDMIFNIYNTLRDDNDRMDLSHVDKMEIIKSNYVITRK